jgi:hypothetical protein
VEDLGFDPENPMVRVEVSQIMRMRASLYPENLSRRSSNSADDLPVLFVEDVVPAQSASVLQDPVLKNVLYSLAGMGVLAVVVGLIIMRMANRRDS